MYNCIKYYYHYLFITCKNYFAQLLNYELFLTNIQLSTHKCVLFNEKNIM